VTVKTLAIALAVLIGVLTALAHASPPDQTWLTGFFDDADHDDVILIITSLSGAPVTPPSSLPGLVLLGTRLPSRAPVDVDLAERAPAYFRRAPPAA